MSFDGGWVTPPTLYRVWRGRHFVALLILLKLILNPLFLVYFCVFVVVANIFFRNG